MNIIQDKTLNTTSVEALGEFGLIDHLTNSIKIKNNSTIYGVGDDAAVVKGRSKHILLSTDMLLSLIHISEPTRPY